MIVGLFEDESCANFLPLTYTRPVFECRSGMFSFLERAQKIFPESDFVLFTRDYLVPTLRKRVSYPVNKPDVIDDELLLINGSLIVDEEGKRLVKAKLSGNVLIKQGGRIVLPTSWECPWAVSASISPSTWPARRSTGSR